MGQKQKNTADMFPAELAAESVHHQKLVVSKSNKLVDAFTKLTKNEYKLLAACIAKINPQYDYQGKRIVIELTTPQIAALTGIDPTNVYKFLDKAAKSYHTQAIETPGKLDGEVDYINIAHRSRYMPEKGIFRIEFHELMQDELVQLASYTSYELRFLVSLSSKYSMHLYEHITKSMNKKIAGKQNIKIILPELQYSLGIIDIDGNPKIDYLIPFNEFKRRVLVPGLAEIDENTDICFKKDENGDVEFIPHRRGRKFYLLEMVVWRKGESLPDASLEDKMIALGITKGAANAIIQRNDTHKVERNVEYLDDCLAEGKAIKSAGGFLQYLLKYDVAALPQVANPFSPRYKDNKAAQAFVRQILVPNWWEIPAETREDIEQNGIKDAAESEVSTLFGHFKTSFDNVGLEDTLLEFNEEVMRQILVDGLPMDEVLYGVTAD